MCVHVETVRVFGGAGVYCPACHSRKIGRGPWRELGPAIVEQRATD